MTRFRQLSSAIVMLLAPGMLLSSGIVVAQIRSTQAPPASSPQGQPPPPATGMIAGSIVDAGTGKGVGGAIVSLFFSPPPRPPLPPGTTLSPAELAAIQAASTPKRIMTDGSGAFVFHSLQKGSFRLSVEAAGFLSGGFGQLRPSGPTRQLDVDEGERRTGVTIKLWPYCSLSGIVLDEFGDPAITVSLRLLRVTTVNGQRRIQPLQTTQTDDRGAYRFGQLSPGEYLVAAPQTVTSMPLASVDFYMQTVTKPGGSADVAEMNRDLQSSGAPPISAPGIRLGDQQYLTSTGPSRVIAPPAPGHDGKTFAYHTTFFPSAPTASEATPIVLVSGQERSGVDLQLRPVQTVRVSGFVTGPGGLVPNMGLKLVPANSDLTADNGLETASTATDAFGGFTFPSVPVGSYTVRVLSVPRNPQPPLPPPRLDARGLPVPTPMPPPPPPAEQLLWAEMPVSVGDSDVTGLNVVLHLGSKISGRIAFEGSAPVPTADQIQRMSISVTSADGRPTYISSSTRPGAGGLFTTIGFPPGKYFVSASASLPGWYFRGATMGGRTLEDDPLNLEGSDVGGITLTFVDRTTLLTGTVRDTSTPRDMSATLFIFPVNYVALIERGAIGRRTRNTSIGGSGAFAMSGLQPGDYLAAAVNPEQISDVRDRAFYDALARVATRFSLADGEKKTLDLTVSPIR